MDGSLSTFDGIGLAILLASGLLALIRGFVREALSVTAFVAAALATLWSLPVFRGPAAELVQPGIIGVIGVGAFVFILIYLAVTFVTSSLSKGLKSGEDVSVVDRTLGFAFGIVRGLVLLGLGVIFFSGMDETGQPPRWITEARIYPLVNASARALQALAPESSRVGGSRPLARAEDDPIADRIRNDDTPYSRDDQRELDDRLQELEPQDS